jgi:hypothetical protein
MYTYVGTYLCRYINLFLLMPGDAVAATTPEQFKKAKFQKKSYYIPTFAGTYASRSPYWIPRPQSLP